ncbi:unnamed protein product [Schistocephalus solidus]|uniref:Uncharacterized protein n=1 Tax=Schistocephalus solidus TaxID=70667 RepID=A0A183SBJ7_SCHSO|nr:unnamed protein product [Schistocephalus solidus]
MPNVEKVPVSSVGDADPRLLITEGVHQHSREHETDQGGGQYAGLFHSIGHCECFGYRPVVSDARCHPVMKLTHHVHVLSISPPDENIVQQIPAPRPRVDPRGLLQRRKAEEGVSQQETVFRKRAHKKEAVIVAATETDCPQYSLLGSGLHPDAPLKSPRTNNLSFFGTVASRACRYS